MKKVRVFGLFSYMRFIYVSDDCFVPYTRIPKPYYGVRKPMPKENPGPSASWNFPNHGRAWTQSDHSEKCQGHYAALARYRLTNLATVSPSPQRRQRFYRSNYSLIRATKQNFSLSLLIYLCSHLKEVGIVAEWGDWEFLCLTSFCSTRIHGGTARKRNICIKGINE